MGKTKKAKRSDERNAMTAVRAGNHRAYVEALADGRRERANTFADRRAKANRQACRGRFSPHD